MRKKEFNIRWFQLYGLVSRYIIKTTDLHRADLEVLMYLNGIDYFTIDDFRYGTLLYSWDVRRFMRLRETGWIVKLETQKNDGKYKFAVSAKTKQMLTRMGKLLSGQELLPETPRTQSYVDKLYAKVITKFNRENELV